MPDERFDWVRSDLFPFISISEDGDPVLRPLDPPVVPEPPRRGEDGPAGCGACQGDDAGFVWVDDRWRISVISGLAVPLALSVSPRAHLDSPDLPDEFAAELGLVLVRVERAVLAAGDIGRVHFSKWCDGGAHLHWWVLARPLGALQQRGSFLVLWAQTLEPPPEQEVSARAAAVGQLLARHSGWVPT